MQECAGGLCAERSPHAYHELPPVPLPVDVRAPYPTPPTPPASNTVMMPQPSRRPAVAVAVCYSARRQSGLAEPLTAA
jgi:hypothetical protein